MHDIGHLAAGHTLEDELELIGKHDADERLDLILNKSDWGRATSLTLRQTIDSKFATYVPPGLSALGFTATDIVRFLIRKPPSGKDTYEEMQQHFAKSEEIRQQVCSNMIGNTICADLLDYIYRDWYHGGKPRSPDDRIFQYMEVRRPKRNGTSRPTEPKPHADDRFVISLGGKTKIRTDGVSAILGLLEWRYELAETVLFHRTKLAAGAMLDRALFELWSDSDESELVARLLPLSDDQLIDEAIREATEKSASASPGAKQRFDAATSILQRLSERSLFKELSTFDATNIPDNNITKIKKSYADLNAQTKAGAKRRAETARLLEFDFELPPGSVAIYCSHVKPKIAEVSIDVDGEILTFSEYEKAHKNRLSGGHLEAQIDRFERLWRMHFFLNAEVKKGLTQERLLLLQQTIEDLVLPIEEPDRLVQKAKEKALAYVHQEKQAGNGGTEFVDELIAAARSDSAVAQSKVYPNGAPSIRNFIRKR